MSHQDRIVSAAREFLDTCPIGDGEKPYVTDVCNGAEFDELVAAVGDLARGEIRRPESTDAVLAAAEPLFAKIRALVAGWHWDPNFSRHADALGVMLNTTAGVCYAISDAMGSAEPGPAPPAPSRAETMELVRKLHAGQSDKAGAPFVEHLFRVEEIHRRLWPVGPSTLERLACLLHDVIEDTDTTAEDLLRMGFSKATVEIVEIVTRRPTEVYGAFILRIVQSGNIGAMRVKLADNTDNLDVARLMKLKPEVRAKIERRYLPARERLIEGIEAASRMVASDARGITPRPIAAADRDMHGG